MTQKNVPAVKDGQFSIVNGKLETKPHGHGDVHLKMFTTGMAKAYKDMGKSRTLFIQDTNGSGMNFVLPMLGSMAKNDKKLSVAGVYREDGEKVGALGILGKGKGYVGNVEYNILGNAKGYHSGNINQYILDTDDYADILSSVTIPEMTNVKPGKSSRLESLMQDIFASFGANDAEIVTFQDKATGFSPAKNGIVTVVTTNIEKVQKNLAEAKAKTGAERDEAEIKVLEAQLKELQFLRDTNGDMVEGIRIVKSLDGANTYYVMSNVGDNNVVYATFASKLSDTMATAENDNYDTFRKLLEATGKVVFDGSTRQVNIIGIPFRQLGAEVFLDKYGTPKALSERMTGENKISQNSSVYFSGNIGMNNAVIDGAIRINAVKGANVTITGQIKNAGYTVKELTKVEIAGALKRALDRKAKDAKYDESEDADLQDAIRGYRYEKAAELDISIDKPGEYFVRGDVETGKVKLYKVINGKEVVIAEYDNEKEEKATKEEIEKTEVAAKEAVERSEEEEKDEDERKGIQETEADITPMEQKETETPQTVEEVKTVSRVAVEEAAKVAKNTANTQATAQKFAIQVVQTDKGEIIFNATVSDKYIRSSKIASVPGIFVSKQAVERIGKEGTELKVVDAAGKEKTLTVRNGKLVSSTGREVMFKFNAVTRTDEDGNTVLEFRLNNTAKQIFESLNEQTQQELIQAAAYSLSDRLGTDMQVIKQLNSNNKIDAKGIRNLIEQLKKDLGSAYTDAEKDRLLAAKLKATTFTGTKDTGFKITKSDEKYVRNRGSQLKKSGVSKVVLSRAKKVQYDQDIINNLYDSGEQVIISIDENEIDNIIEYMGFNHLAGFRITSKAVYDRMLQQGLINAILEQGKELSYVVENVVEIDLKLGNGKIIFVVDPTKINLADNVEMLQKLAKEGRISLYYDSDKELTEQQQQDIKTIFKDCKTMVSVGKSYITNKFASLFNKDIVSRSFEEGIETDLSDIFVSELNVEDIMSMIKPLLTQKDVSFDSIKNLRVNGESIFTKEMMEKINGIENEYASEKVSALRQFVIGALIKYVEDQVPAIIETQKDKFEFELYASDIDTMNKQSRQQIDYRFIQLLMTGRSLEQILTDIASRKLDDTKPFAEILKIANDDIINKKWNDSDMIIDPLTESKTISAEEAIKALLMDSVKVVDVMNSAFNLSTEGIKGILASA
jgi:hypothetical protein